MTALAISKSACGACQPRTLSQPRGLPAETCFLESCRREAFLSAHAVAAADAAQSCSSRSQASRMDHAIVLWRIAQAELSRIVGPQGTLAVLERTLGLARPAFEWLPAPGDLADCDAAIARLAQSHADQPPHEVDAAACALSTTLHDVLASLIGAGLARRMLQDDAVPPR